MGEMTIEKRRLHKYTGRIVSVNNRYGTIFVGFYPDKKELNGCFVSIRYYFPDEENARNYKSEIERRLKAQNGDGIRADVILTSPIVLNRMEFSGDGLIRFLDK